MGRQRLRAVTLPRLSGSSASRVLRTSPLRPSSGSARFPRSPAADGYHRSRSPVVLSGHRTVRHLRPRFTVLPSSPVLSFLFRSEAYFHSRLGPFLENQFACLVKANWRFRARGAIIFEGRFKSCAIRSESVQQGRSLREIPPTNPRLSFSSWLRIFSLLCFYRIGRELALLPCFVKEDGNRGFRRKNLTFSA